jgi:hypothetical protein
MTWKLRHAPTVTYGDTSARHAKVPHSSLRELRGGKDMDRIGRELRGGEKGGEGVGRMTRAKKYKDG